MHTKEYMKKLSKLASIVNTKHGLSRSRIYSIWRHMKKRCDNPKEAGYRYYGGRGITYAKKWRDFEGFYADMGKTYKDGLTLDRINSDGNYTKKNCRWATRFEQSRNSKSNIWIIYRGKKRLAADLAREAGLPHNAFLVRIRKGIPIELAMQKKIPRMDSKKYLLEIMKKV